MTYTLNQITDALTAAAGRPDRGRVFQQLRNLHQRGSLKHFDTGGPKGAFRFAEFEIYVARILSAAVENGIAGDELGRLEATLRHGRTAVFADASMTISLDANLARMTGDNPEQWLIEIARARDLETGQMHSSFAWARRESDGRINRFGSLYPDPLSPEVVMGDGGAVEGVTLLAITKMLAPLIKNIGH